ncbi:hypothetical protein E2C01_053278 [Portunus trituberculatus]|uniref:Uncharacterized protein n=1 Tax=Portunus trituberculatus TaxID=210409 RepID=A0A5B7GJV8_PORTR|nr:hypothetical protein [Portunus trituberculatus]
MLPATDPPFQALTSDLNLMQFNILSLKSPNTKRCVQSHQVRWPGGTVWGLKMSLVCSRPPKDNARRFKKPCPTSVVTRPVARTGQLGEVQRGGGSEQQAWPLPQDLG